MAKMAKQGISRRFSVKNFREKIRAETAGQTDSRQQAPPAKPPRKARRKTPAGAGENRRERMPVAGPAPMAGIMQGGGDGLQNGRAEGFYARGIRYIPGLFTPPYSPPKPHARAERHPCKIHSQHHQHSRQTASTSQHRPPAPPAQREKPHSTEPPAPADSPHNSTTASASTRHSQPAPHQAGQIGTTKAATGATITTGPARRA